MSKLWILGPAGDVSEHYETLSDADNGSSYGDIRDGRPLPNTERRLSPRYKAEQDDVFPDMVSTVYMPCLWSRRMVETLEQVAPRHNCLIFPARIDLKGRKGALPWTHSLVVPMATADGWFDAEKSEAQQKKEVRRLKSGVRLLRPSKIVLHDGWKPTAPVMDLAGIAVSGKVLGVSEEVAGALLALEPRRVLLVPAEEFSDERWPSCDGRTDPAEIAAWKEAERAKGPTEPVPLTDWEAGIEIYQQLRRDRGMVLHDGRWILRRQDMVHREWFLCSADGSQQDVEPARMVKIAQETLAAKHGLPGEALNRWPQTEVLAELKIWQKATAKERRARLKTPQSG